MADDLTSITDLPEKEVLQDSDIEKYAKNLEEFQELKALEEQFSRTSNDLELAKTKLVTIETEIRHAREQEERRKEKIESLLEAGKLKENEQKYEEAIECYLEIIESEPRNARAINRVQEVRKKIKRLEQQRIEQDQEAKKIAKETREHFEAGKRFYRENNFEKALSEFSEALHVGGKNTEIQDFKDRCEQRIQEIEETMNKARKEAEEKKRLVNEYSINANSAFRRREFEEGIKLLEKALILMPDNKEVIESLRQAENKCREHAAQIEKMKQDEMERARKVSEARIKAYEYVRSEEYEKALKDLEQVYLIAPDKEEVLKDLKEINSKFSAYKKEQAQKNEKMLREKIEREDLLKEHYGNGIGFFMVNDYEKASASFSSVVAIDPHYEEVEMYMKKIEERMFTLEKEKKESEAKVAEERKKIEEEKKLLFEAGLRAVAEESYESAVISLEKCFAMEPLNDAFKRELDGARKLLAEKKVKERLEKAKDEEKKEEERKIQSKLTSLNEMAETYYINGNFDIAIEEWNKVILIDANNKPAKDGIIKSLNQKKILEESKTLEEMEKKNLLGRIEKLTFEAKTSFRENNFELATSKFEEILSMDPFNTDAKNGITEIKNRQHEIALCEEGRISLERYLESEEARISELRRTVAEGLKFFRERDYQKALNVWNSVVRKNLSKEA